jgi:hypothetical protein
MTVFFVIFRGVVVQALLLLYYCVCAGEDLRPPSSGDADEGYQWVVQTNEGWVPY